MSHIVLESELKEQVTAESLLHHHRANLYRASEELTGLIAVKGGTRGHRPPRLIENRIKRPDPMLSGSYIKCIARLLRFLEPLGS